MGWLVFKTSEGCQAVLCGFDSHFLPPVSAVPAVQRRSSNNRNTTIHQQHTKETHMERRTFLKAAASLPLAGSLGSAGIARAAWENGSQWKAYEVTTRVELKIGRAHV